MCVKETECEGTFLLDDDAWDDQDLADRAGECAISPPMERVNTEQSLSSVTSLQLVTQNGANDIRYDLTYNSGLIIVPNLVVKKCCGCRTKKHHHI